MGKRGRKAVFVEVDGKKGSKTFIGKGSKVTLCNKCSAAEGKCTVLKALTDMVAIEAPVYACASFAEAVEVETEDKVKE